MKLNYDEYPNELCKIYKKVFGEELDLINPRTYNEKMQWSKLYDNTLLKTNLTDKYLVRDWIKEKIGEQYLIPLLGVWDNFDDIDFNTLPNKFVLKTNHGSGWNLIVNDKNKLDKNNAKVKFNKWMCSNWSFMTFEMHYKDIKPKIIAEQYIEGLGRELEDYKFLCFDGNVNYCWIDIDRFTDHRRNVYDLDWNLQGWQQHSYKNSDYPIKKPENFDLMIQLTKKLAEGFSHVRIDWYNVQGKIYFGEMTFTNSSGFELIHPHKYNLELGDLWKLPIHKNKVLQGNFTKV